MAQVHPKSDAPGLNLGSFHWSTTSELPRLLEPSLGLLDHLSGKTFKGKGFNSIFRPRSQNPLDGGIQPGAPGSDNDLQLNLTQETITFTGPLGLVPNRGLLTQSDIALGGISYIQSVQDVTNKRTGSDDRKPKDIHFEPGVWMIVPASELPSQGRTLNRMASIPHGTTINAQGDYPANGGKKDGPPDIDPPNHVTPFFIESLKPNHQPWQQVGATTNRDPLDLTKFNGTLQYLITRTIRLCSVARKSNDTFANKVQKTASSHKTS